MYNVKYGTVMYVAILQQHTMTYKVNVLRLSYFCLCCQAKLKLKLVFCIDFFNINMCYFCNCVVLK